MNTGPPGRAKDREKGTTMNTIERIKMVKAMEFIARQINDELIFDRWLTGGVADGDIEYGDMWPHTGDEEMLDYYLEDDNFKDLMQTFLRCMASAKKSGGLYCDGVVSEEAQA